MLLLFKKRYFVSTPGITCSIEQTLDCPSQDLAAFSFIRVLSMSVIHSQEISGSVMHDPVVTESVIRSVGIFVSVVTPSKED